MHVHVYRNSYTYMIYVIMCVLFSQLNINYIKQKLNFQSKGLFQQNVEKIEIGMFLIKSYQ